MFYKCTRILIILLDMNTNECKHNCEIAEAKSKIDDHIIYASSPQHENISTDVPCVEKVEAVKVKSKRIYKN